MTKNLPTNPLRSIEAICITTSILFWICSIGFMLCGGIQSKIGMLFFGMGILIALMTFAFLLFEQTITTLSIANILSLTAAAGVFFAALKISVGLALLLVLICFSFYVGRQEPFRRTNDDH